MKLEILTSGHQRHLCFLPAVKGIAVSLTTVVVVDVLVTSRSCSLLCSLAGQVDGGTVLVPPTTWQTKTIYKLHNNKTNLPVWSSAQLKLLLPYLSLSLGGQRWGKMCVLNLTWCWTSSHWGCVYCCWNLSSSLQEWRGCRWTLPLSACSRLLDQPKSSV